MLQEVKRTKQRRVMMGSLRLTNPTRLLLHDPSGTIFSCSCESLVPVLNPDTILHRYP